MNLRRKGAPLAAAIALLLVALGGLREPVPDTPQPLPAELQAAIVQRLGAGQAQGHVDLLRQADSVATLSRQLLDREGRLLAEWPPALTRSSWGPFAPALQALRTTFWQWIGRREVQELQAGGRRVGEIVGLHLPGPARFARGHGLDLLLALLATWALLSALRADRVPPAPATARAQVPATGSVERLGLRLGGALDQAELGLVLLDARQRVRYMNHAAAQACGWDRRAALNRPVYAVLRVEESDAANGNMFSFDGHQPQSERLDLTLVAREGSRRLMDATLLRLRRRGSQEWAGMLILLRSQDGSAQDQDAMRREAQLAETTLDALAEGVAVCDRYGRILRVNRRLNRLFAYAEGELQGMTVAKLLPVPFLNEPGVTLEHYLGERQEGRPRVVGWRKNATTFQVDLQVHELNDDEYPYLLLIRDSGERLRQDNLSMRLGRLLDYAAEEIYIFDAHSLYFTEANREAKENLGYSMEQLGRMTPLHLAPGLVREQLDQDLNALRNGERRQVSYRTEHRRANGTVYPVSLRLSYSPEEEPPVFMALAQDITDQRAAELRLEYMAHNDVLTSLPNRAALTEHLQHLLRLPESAGQVSVFFLDLDRFKQINDSYGHAAGDEVLIELTRRLRERLPEDHFLARLSGDEFVIAALGTDTIEVERTAQSLLEAMQAPFQTGAGSMGIGVCIGIAHRLPGDTTTTLMHRADVAMYRAKAGGGQSWVLADPADSESRRLE